VTGAVRSAVGLFGPINAFDPFGPFGTLTSFGIDVPQGDPTAIAHAASVLQTLSGALTDQGKSIAGAAQTATKWQGPAASAYAEYSSHVAGVCSGNAGACHDAATALQTFSAALATAQSVTSQAAGDFTTAANEMTQHQQVATAAGMTAQTARLQAMSEPHPVVQAKLQQQASTAEQEQASAQKAAAAAQAAGEAAQQRGQKALDTYQQDVQALTKQLTAAASHIRQAPALPGAHASSAKHKGGGFWGAVLPIVGMVALDGAEEFFSAGLATPAVAAEDAAIMGADAAATGAAESEVPTVVFSRARAPGIGKNFDQAVSDGHPTTLNLSSKAARRANRRQALSGHPPAPAGQSLDEYPFASSTQGGAGAHVGPVPEAEQQYQGGVLSSFYQKNAIQEGDPFGVRFDP
jgi:hypothetical protein